MNLYTTNCKHNILVILLSTYDNCKAYSFQIKRVHESHMSLSAQEVSLCVVIIYSDSIIHNDRECVLNAWNACEFNGFSLMSLNLTRQEYAVWLMHTSDLLFGSYYLLIKKTTSSAETSHEQNLADLKFSRLQYCPVRLISTDWHTSAWLRICRNVSTCTEMIKWRVVFMAKYNQV